MKKSIIFLLIVALASCENHKEDAEKLQRKVDSLQNVTVQKDETIEGFLSDFTEIQANLDSIKKIEEMIDVPGTPEREISQSNKDRVVADIAAINSLLEQNRGLIASLRSRINNSNFQTGKLESMVNELEQLTKNLQENVAEKDRQIANLSEKVEEQTENISQLNERISEIQVLSERQLDSIRMQEAALNKAYYTVGTINELKDSGVIERQGGILGIGSTPVVRQDFTEDDFIEVDLRQFDYLPLNSKKADVVSVHPLDSYYISGEKSADTLFVEDPAEFWSASKYLVIVTK